ncbi:MAG: hypothetical protein N3D82_00330 [Ignisphaera sp.]|nr:hypothetical protein [Ignisphaera sp.]MCX8167462.1 hypothetical protein [Ignisphaera sp.]MDW8084674.1 hypothetical protein [Ignisphaera sp.]
MGSIFSSWLNQFVNYLPLALAILILSLALLVSVAVYVEPPENLRGAIEDEIRSVSVALTNTSFIERIYIIFTRNALINILFALPFFINVVVYMSTMITTAWALNISAVNLEIATGIPRQLSIVSLMLMPHTYLELYSYSLSIIASLKLTLSFLSRRIDRTLLYNFILTVLVSHIMLLTAAIVETVLITFIQ